MGFGRRNADLSAKLSTKIQQTIKFKNDKGSPVKVSAEYIITVSTFDWENS